MCGICGAVALGGAPVTTREIEPVADAMRLRGPDDAGFFTDGAGALGHRRLSIIDLAGGHQPLGNEDGSVLTVLNGEIYNFVALRKELAGLGHVFSTRSDTETVVHAWEQWGPDAVAKLDGMFALAVWDKKARRLLLARDRFGKKPLVWFQDRERFVFASTVTALLRHERAPRVVDPAALAQYLALEFVPAPQSMIAGVRKLEAGTFMLVDSDGKVSTRSYWRPAIRARSGPAPSGEEIGERIRSLLVSAAKKRLVADVPVGIFLSGGIDSSSVVAAAANAGAGRIRTFSIGFQEKSFDESGYARLVARHFGTEHVEEVLEPRQLLDIVPTLGEILDEPMADASIVPTFLLSRLARRHVTVALGGDGGDELFAGYPTYAAHRLASFAALALRGPMLSLARRAVRLLPVSHANLSLDFKIKTMLDGLAHPEPVRNYVWLGAFRPDEVEAITGRPIGVEELLAPVRREYEQAPGATHLERVLYQDVRLYLSHMILAKVDRASMANSLEVRAPFLDTELAEYVGGLSLHEKLRGFTGKASLKRAVEPWLPRAVVHRPKKGFGMPIGAWLRGPLEAFTRASLLDGGGLAGSGLVSRTPVERLLDQHRNGSADHRKRLWSLLVLEMWRKEHLGSRAVAQRRAG